jgi:hypothetical protein
VNSIAPAYEFQLTPDRFDTQVASAFAATKNARLTRDRLIAQLRDGGFDHLLLGRLDGLETLGRESIEKAALNIIDFHFEPLVLQSMSLAQVDAYFMAVEKTLALTEAKGLDGDGPLWIDTVHHACVFSVLYRLAVFLARNRGYRQLVLLHQGQRPEPRLAIISNLVRQIPQVKPVLLRLQGRWFQDLTQITTPDTAIFYLTDMPAVAFERRAPAARSFAHIQLYAAPGISLRLDTMSGSGIFARRLKAAHVVVEYPRADRIRLRPYDAANPTTRCPLEDWMFWPLMGQA